MNAMPRNSFSLLAAIERCEQRVLLSAGSVGASVSLTTDPTGVSSQLLALTQGETPAVDPLLVYDNSGRVEVRITAKDVAALAAPLAAIGFDQVAAEPTQHYVEGFIPIPALATINGLTGDGLMGVLPSLKPQTSAGEIDSEGDSILEADRTRAALGDTGAGVTVGVLSDSYNNKGGAASDITTGDLPSAVNVLQEDPSGGTDEGRAMLQIVHDLAPGASLAFATADISEASYAQNILNLAAPVASGGAGANVICDDEYYFDEPVFQDGTIADAIDTVVTSSSVSYFSAAGNDGTQAYNSANVNFNSATIPGISTSPQSYYNYNPAGTADDMQSLTLNQGQSLLLGLQWDQPFYTTSGVTSQLNIFLLDSTGTVVASATDNAIANQEPFQFLYYTNQTAGNPQNFSLVIQNASSVTPDRINYQNFGNGRNVQFNDYATNSPTIVPHSASANAFSVAAAPAYNRQTPESFTSEGPATIVFNSSGGRLAIPQVRAKPDATAIDGVSTTFFLPGSFGYNGYPQFYGTSAATPHAAAIGALIKAVDPSWTPAQIYADLRATVDPNIGTGNVNFTGAGLIDAYRAVAGSSIPAVATVNDGFESGALGQDWTTYSSGTGRTDVTAGNGPASGTYQLVEDSIYDGFAFPSLSESILNLSVPAYATNLVLTFSEKKFSGSAHGSSQTDYPMPATFTGHGNYDGVALSVNGINWYSILSLVGSASTTTYQTHTFNLSAIAATDGLTLGSTTLIKFQHYDVSYSAPDGGLAFDNVAVSTALSLTGPAYDLKLDADGTHLDIYNANNSGGALYSQVLAAEVTNVTVTGTGSPQTLTVDFSNGSPFAAGLIYNASGTATSNRLIVIGSTSGNDTVTAGTGVITVNGIALSATDIGNLSFAAGAGTDAIAVNSGTLTLAQRTGSGIITDLFSTISIAATAKLAVAPPVTQGTRTLLQTAAVSIAGSTNAWTGTLDLNANDLAVTGGTLATITNEVASGTSRGTGITSSAAAANTTHLTALGAILNTVNGTQPLYGSGTGLVTFDGSSPGPSAILVKYTYYGDTNLDGKTDASDYSRVDSAYLADRTAPASVTGWFNGDFNFDATVNGTDYTLIDNAFNRQSASLAATIATVRIKQQADVFAPIFVTSTTASDVFAEDRFRRRHRAIDDLDL